MACSKSLDFAAAAGAHLSFYWTMDEAGAADKVDSAVGLHWPLQFGASGVAGLFSNGTSLPHGSILNQHPGLGMFANASVAINQAVSKGISVWFWLKPVTQFTGEFSMDTSDPLHTNRFRVLFGPFNGSGPIEVGHTNDTDDVFADSANVTWTLGAWHMVAATYDKIAQTSNLYIDGALAATAPDAFTYQNLTSTDMLFVSLDLGGVSQGVGDELGLCLNGALTQAQITSLWNGGAGVTWPGVTAIVPFP